MTDDSGTPPVKCRFPVDIAFVWLGAVLILYGFFSPWLSRDGFSISGYRMLWFGYRFLLLLPVAALFGLVYSIYAPKKRPLPIMFAGTLGLMSIITLATMAFNYDDGPLIFQYQAETGARLEFIQFTQVHVFNQLRHVSMGLYLVVFGSVLSCIAPFFRAKADLPRENLIAAGCASQRRINTLEELKPAWTLRKEFFTTVAYFITGVVLIYTYIWCDISPITIWENRNNAREYLFGNQLKPEDLDDISRQTMRAPEIEAQGRAREFQDNKYRNVPISQQPSLEVKFKENDRLVKQFLEEMSEAEKKRLGERAYRKAIDEKKAGYFPPETSWARVRGYLTALLETVAIAIWGTLLAIVCAVPASLFAAGNTLQIIVSGEGFQGRVIRWFSIFFVRRFLDACRGFNEFVMALIFVAVIGLGPFAGILALWIHTFGILGKVFSEQIEAIEGGQIEALKSTGAGVSQIIVFSVLPQIMPGLVSYSLLRFESNVRSATILGFVGAGGIGFLMFDKLNGYLFKEVCTMMIIIIMAVSVIDYLCGKLRRRFI